MAASTELVVPYRAAGAHIISIPRRDELAAKLAKIRIPHLHVIADFDMTLTRYLLKNGKRGHSTHVLVQECGAFGDQFKETSAALFNKYYPIEIDDSVPHAEKLPMMVKWWEGAHQIMVDAKLHRDTLSEIGRSPTIDLRDRTDELLALTQVNVGAVLVKNMRRARLYPYRYLDLDRNLYTRIVVDNISKYAYAYHL